MTDHNAYTLHGKMALSLDPFSLFNIELTNRCIMRCVMCPRTNHMTRLQGIMDVKLFQKIIDELASDNISFIRNRILWLHHFGESLLHPQWDECIRYAEKMGIYTGLSINPIMLTDKVIQQLVLASPHILYISLDGHDDESFYKIRGMKNAYDTSVDRLQQYLSIKVKEKSNTTIVLSMIQFKLNEQSIEQKRAFWEQYPGVDTFLMKAFTTWDGNAPDIHDLKPDASLEKKQSHHPDICCTFPWDSMTITWDGDVVPCCFDYNKRLILGNCQEDALKHIWNGEAMQNLRQEFLGRAVHNPLCRNCEKLHVPRHLWK